MKIVLTFDEMVGLPKRVSDKSAENVSPLRYVKNVDVIRKEGA